MKRTFYCHIFSWHRKLVRVRFMHPEAKENKNLMKNVAPINIKKF